MSMIGKTLAHYEITSQLGKGGMGEVYRAKDKKLGRDVAIKVLPEEFAKDADRVARFQREAKLLASLNHPNIAAIHGLEESGGTNFLVLELVEGGTLADRIRQGPIPVEEALKLALQIAEALEAAHEKGVIHRDLKPANIKVTPDGKVKVLDFGLAKAFAGEQSELNLSNSPTLSNAATQQGVILGTAAYMSPEQARGRAVDRRADIWAFGCVLFEMLSGQPAFQGEDVTEILASVVKGGANFDLLPQSIHPRVREVLSRCLQKDPRRRYRDVGDVQFDLEQVLPDPSGILVRPVPTGEQRRKLWPSLLWQATAIILIAVIAGMAVWNLKRPAPPRVVRFEYELPQEQQLTAGRSIVISPDGNQFAYCTPKGIYLRSINDLNAKFVPGTEDNPRAPFFSPDNQWVGFWQGGQIKKISISGGTPIKLCDAAVVYGVEASWEDDKSILFGMGSEGVWQVSPAGGTPRVLIPVNDAKGESAWAPQLLPGGRAVLFTLAFGPRQDPIQIVVHSLETGERKLLVQGGRNGRYFPSTGHLIYIKKGALVTVPFNSERLEITGDEVPLIEGMLSEDYGLNRPNFSVADNGSLVYVSGAGQALKRTLLWMDRQGREEAVNAPARAYMYPRLSPDGTQVAIDSMDQDRDVWVWNFTRQMLTRITVDRALDIYPLWTPDGRRIVFSSQREGPFNLYWQTSDGSGLAERLISSQNPQFPQAFSPDGLRLIIRKDDPQTRSDLAVLALEKERRVENLVGTPFTEVNAAMSPDGKWFAYQSNESGQNEIYVRPFPQAERERWQVSTGGGTQPVWSRDGRELFYIAGSSQMMAVSVHTEPAFTAQKPKLLFEQQFFLGPTGHTYDVSPDGKRFIMIRESTPVGGTITRITVVLNWTEELKQRVPVK
jgi:eukaryotic-like serine/threonine-protein kinase